MPAPSRTPARARQRDPADTRRRILDAAERLFIARGFDGVSIRDIAVAARVGTSLVMHHGGSKVELWSLVKERLFASYATGQEAELRRSAATPELLVGSLRTYFLWLREHPQFLRLMAWRDLAGNDQLSGPEAGLLDLARQRMREARDAGWFHRDIDPELALFAVFSMLEAWFVSGKRACFPGDDERYLDTVLALLRSGLIARTS
jgi:AcrR family transcriptional regulator